MMGKLFLACYTTWGGNEPSSLIRPWRFPLRQHDKKTRERKSFIFLWKKCDPFSNNLMEPVIRASNRWEQIFRVFSKVYNGGKETWNEVCCREIIRLNIGRTLQKFGEAIDQKTKWMNCFRNCMELLVNSCSYNHWEVATILRLIDYKGKQHIPNHR